MKKKTLALLAIPTLLIISGCSSMSSHGWAVMTEAVEQAGREVERKY